MGWWLCPEGGRHGPRRGRIGRVALLSHRPVIGDESRGYARHMSDQLIQLEPRIGIAGSTEDRATWEGRARLLAWGGIAWHFIEFGIAIAAGIAAGSIALIGFGADSLIEAVAGFVVIWLFTGSRLHSHSAERRAQQMIAASFFDGGFLLPGDRLHRPDEVVGVHRVEGVGVQEVAQDAEELLVADEIPQHVQDQRALRVRAGQSNMSAGLVVAIRHDGPDVLRLRLAEIGVQLPLQVDRALVVSLLVRRSTGSPSTCRSSRSSTCAPSCGG